MGSLQAYSYFFITVLSIHFCSLSCFAPCIAYNSLFLHKFIFMQKIILIILASFFVTSFSWSQAETSRVWTLSECIHYALEQNIQVQQSEISNSILNEQLLQAKATRLPSLNASASQQFSSSKSYNPP